MIFTPPPMSLIERSPGWRLALLNRLGKAGLERRHVLLEAGRVDVRQVIGDDFQPLRLGGSAFGRDVHSVRHADEEARRCAPLRLPVAKQRPCRTNNTTSQQRRKSLQTSNVRSSSNAIGDSR